MLRVPSCFLEARHLDTLRGDVHLGFELEERRCIAGWMSLMQEGLTQSLASSRGDEGDVQNAAGRRCIAEDK